MRLIDPSQRIKVLWDNDDGTRYTEEMTIRRLLAVMSDDEIKTVAITCCGECRHNSLKRMSGNSLCELGHAFSQLYDYCSDGERRADDE